MNNKLGFTRVVGLSRAYIESWRVVLSFLAGLKSNTDFANLSCEPEEPQSTEFQHPSIRAGGSHPRRYVSRSAPCGKHGGRLSKEVDSAARARSRETKNRPPYAIHRFRVARKCRIGHLRTSTLS